MPWGFSKLLQPSCINTKTQSSCDRLYRNQVALLPQLHLLRPSFTKMKLRSALALSRPKFPLPSVLAWPAWLRVLAVLPALALLWGAVLWAGVEAAPL